MDDASTPATAGDLDTATLLSLVGSLAERRILDALQADGYAVTRAHGYVFQRLLTGAQSISELAADLGITQQGASKHVAELERQGLVSRRVSPVDGRARIVELTTSGRSAIASARAARADFERDAADLLGDRALSALRESLAAFVDAAGLSPRIPHRRIPLG
jgi:DNA-binding MarR family transcriptional regulator